MMQEEDQEEPKTFDDHDQITGEKDAKLDITPPSPPDLSENVSGEVEGQETSIELLSPKTKEDLGIRTEADVGEEGNDVSGYSTPENAVVSPEVEQGLASGAWASLQSVIDDISQGIIEEASKSESVVGKMSGVAKGATSASLGLVSDALDPEIAQMEAMEAGKEPSLLGFSKLLSAGKEAVISTAGQYGVTEDNISQTREWAGEAVRKQVDYVGEVTTPYIGAVKGTLEQTKSFVQRVVPSAGNTLNQVATEGEYKSLLCQENATELVIPRGARHTAPYFLPKGSALCWEFMVKEYDIAFGVKQRVQEIGGATEKWLKNSARYQAGEVFRGQYEPEDEPVHAILEWDNSFSRFRQKSIAYRAVVMKDVALSPLSTSRKGLIEENKDGLQAESSAAKTSEKTKEGDLNKVGTKQVGIISPGQHETSIESVNELPSPIKPLELPKEFPVTPDAAKATFPQISTPRVNSLPSLEVKKGVSTASYEKENSPALNVKKGVLKDAQQEEKPAPEKTSQKSDDTPTAPKHSEEKPEEAKQEKEKEEQEKQDQEIHNFYKTPMDSNSDEEASIIDTEQEELQSKLEATLEPAENTKQENSENNSDNVKFQPVERQKSEDPQQVDTPLEFQPVVQEVAQKEVLEVEMQQETQETEDAKNNGATLEPESSAAQALAKNQKETEVNIQPVESKKTEDYQQADGKFQPVERQEIEDPQEVVTPIESQPAVQEVAQKEVFEAEMQQEMQETESTKKNDATLEPESSAAQAGTQNTDVELDGHPAERQEIDAARQKGTVLSKTVQTDTNKDAKNETQPVEVQEAGQEQEVDIIPSERPKAEDVQLVDQPPESQKSENSQPDAWAQLAIDSSSTSSKGKKKKNKKKKKNDKPQDA